MRWLFLLLLMLNGFYYIWHQQEAPPRVKEVTPLALYRSAQQDIRLLSESGVGREGATVDRCLYLGGLARQEDLRVVEQRLNSLDIQSQFQSQQGASGAVYWLKISPDSHRLVDEEFINGLAQDFPLLKNKIMSCEGIATSD